MIYAQAHSIREIDEARWDSVTADSLHMTHRWLRATETSWRFYQPYYLLLENEDGPCAAVLANTSTAFQKQFGWLGWLYNRFNLIIRPPFSSSCSVVVRPGVALDTVMPELNAAFNHLSRQEKRLLVTVGNVSAVDVMSWQKAGFQATPIAGVNTINLPATYEDYLAPLHKSKRQELRRIRKRAAQFDIRLEIGTLGNDSEEVLALLYEVYARHGVSQEDMPFASQFLDALAKEMPGELLLIRGYAGDKLVGVSVNGLNGSRVIGLMMGLYYEIARPSLLYFVLIDELIRWSIQQGFQQLSIGRTNEREKQKHGFHVEERWVCHRAHVQPLNWATKIASQLAQRTLRFTKSSQE